MYRFSKPGPRIPVTAKDALARHYWEVTRCLDMVNLRDRDPDKCRWAYQVVYDYTLNCDTDQYTGTPDSLVLLCTRDGKTTQRKLGQLFALSFRGLPPEVGKPSPVIISRDLVKRGR
jgi:hypothetical protein